MAISRSGWLASEWISDSRPKGEVQSSIPLENVFFSFPRLPPLRVVVKEAILL